jgi:hypothetical protein
MTLKTHTRFELAENQLRAALGLFVSGGDRFSVISLAGAADVIFSRLLTNEGKQNFTELSMLEHRELGDAEMTKETYGRIVNDTLGINDFKHMDDDDDDFVDIDPEECAIAAIAKALVNYVMLPDHDKNMVPAFKAWMRLNLDPDKYNVNCDPEWKPTPPFNGEGPSHAETKP